MPNEPTVYKDVTLRVQAEQHAGIEFVPQAHEIDEQELATLWEKGRKAWKDVKSASAWVEAMRGNT